MGNAGHSRQVCEAELRSMAVSGCVMRPVSAGCVRGCGGPRLRKQADDLGESRRGESSGMTVPPRRSGEPVARQTGDPGNVRGAQQGRWRLRMMRHQGAGAG